MISPLSNVERLPVSIGVLKCAGRVHLRSLTPSVDDGCAGSHEQQRSCKSCRDLTETLDNVSGDQHFLFKLAREILHLVVSSFFSV